MNGHATKFSLPRGGSDASATGDTESAREHVIEIPVKRGVIRQGGNEINLAILAGSWMVFDQVRLEGPKGVVEAPIRNVFIRDVRVADYETVDAGRRAQPLLIDVEHIGREPELSVRIDGKRIFTATVEQGRYRFEAPMPAVSAPTNSLYEILVDGDVLEKGEVRRSRQRLITPAEYVDTRIGTAHSRWMIAPGPWMPFGMVKLSPDNQNTGWQAGYDPSFENIGGFSHIHEWTMAGVSMMPTAGPLEIRQGRQGDPDSGYRSRFEKSTEQAPIA